MGRLVRIPRELAVDDLTAEGINAMLSGQAQHNVQPGDSYLERIAKYVPAEVLAFTIFVNAILDQAIRANGKLAMMAGFPVTSIAQIALMMGIVVVPLFVWYVRQEGDAWITNAIMSMLAFPFWAYAMGNVAFAEHRDGHLAVILLATFTMLSGFVRPIRRRLRRRKEAKSAKDMARLVEMEPSSV
jgi:hypothetical protein